jgi:nucleotide-binding universal stress UspA family protein
MVRIKVRVIPSPDVPADEHPADRSVVHAAVTDVVVPLDGSESAERAVPVAAALAASLGAHLHLLSTVDDLPDQSPTTYLEDVAARIEGVVDTDVALDQDPVVTIVDHAATPGTVVCMTTHARGRLVSALHPDIASAVVAATDAPVVLVGPRCVVDRLGAGPVIVAHDGTPPCTDASMPMVDLAAALRRPIEVVRVASAPPVTPGDRPYADTDAHIAPLLERARDRGLDASERIVFGSDVDGALLAEAARVGASMIAMGTHRRSRAERFVEGSTTLAVAHDASVPVVAHHVQG